MNNVNKRTTIIIVLKQYNNILTHTKTTTEKKKKILLLDPNFYTNPASFSERLIIMSFTALNTAETLSVLVAHVICV